MTAATAITAPIRARVGRSRQSSTSANAPPAMDTAITGRARPVRRSNRCGAPSRSGMTPTSAATPATEPDQSARRRQAACSATSCSRAASAVRNAAARNAVVSTARTPPTSDAGPVHEVHRSPDPSSGTRPATTAPAIVPSTNGVTTDEDAKIAPKMRACAMDGANLRKANALPRSTMPRPASMSGTKRVSQMAANAAGKPVHRYTRTKISHTWLASHTGPMLWSMRVRIGAPRRASPAVRSQMPEPKSAPANTA